MSSHKVVSQHLQDCFVRLCIVDSSFLTMARTAIKPVWFSSQVTEDIIRLCYSFYDQFQEAPENHLHDELVRFLYKADEDKKTRYYKYVEQINEMDAPNKEYVISNFSKFARARELEEALIESAPLVERGQFDKVREILQRALKAGIAKEEEGIEYPGNWPPSYHSAPEFGEIVCPTGISLIDRRIKGVYRTRLTCIFAGYKVGKTWGCIQIATEALKHGKKVLEISHEASAGELEMRHDMMWGSLVSEETEEDVEFHEYDENGEKIGSFVENRDSVFNPDMMAVKKVRDQIRGFGGEARFKKYPMGTCSIGEIERYLDYLETFKHFIPDLLINDYVEKMKLPTASQGRDQINEAYINLKRIANERKIAVITASQIKTKFLESSNISEAGAAAEDARKLGNIDLGLFFGMNRIQARRGLMQAYVLVNRSGSQKFGCIVSRNLKVGQLVLDNWPIRFDGNGNENEQT